MQERYVRERKLKDVVTDFIEEIERRSEEDVSNVRMMTGIPALDRILHGFAKQELIYIAARPGMGKSAFAIHVVLNAVMEQGFRILYISLEMGERQIFGRMMANLSEVDSSKILHDNNFSKTKEYEVVKNYALALSEQPLFIRTMGVNTPAGIYSQAQQIQAKHGLDAIIIDHVHLMSSGIKGDEANQNANMSHISNELKRMAIEFDIPVIALAQLSRAVEQRKDRHPELSDMRDSGTLEQDADKVIMMYREQYYTREILPVDTVDISVKKHRDGQTGSVSMIFEKQYSRFKPVDFGGTTEPKNYKVPV
jgi:replicative DNA helicase